MGVLWKLLARIAVVGVGVSGLVDAIGHEATVAEFALGAMVLTLVVWDTLVRPEPKRLALATELAMPPVPVPDKPAQKERATFPPMRSGPT